MRREEELSLTVKWVGGEGRFYPEYGFLEHDTPLTAAQRKKITAMCQHYYKHVAWRRDVRVFVVTLAGIALTLCLLVFFFLK